MLLCILVYIVVNTATTLNWVPRTHPLHLSLWGFHVLSIASWLQQLDSVSWISKRVTLQIWQSFGSLHWFFLQAIRVSAQVSGTYTDPASGITFATTFIDSSQTAPGFTLGIALPPTAATVSSNDYIGLIVSLTKSSHPLRYQKLLRYQEFSEIMKLFWIYRSPPMYAEYFEISRGF